MKQASRGLGDPQSGFSRGALAGRGLRSRRLGERNEKTRKAAEAGDDDVQKAVSPSVEDANKVKLKVCALFWILRVSGDDEEKKQTLLFNVEAGPNGTCPTTSLTIGAKVRRTCDKIKLMDLIINVL